MTTRTSRAIRTGLRRIIADPKASRGMRMKAIQLLIAIEGVQQGTKGTAPALIKSGANARRLKELAEQIQQGCQENVDRDDLALSRSVNEST